MRGCLLICLQVLLVTRCLIRLVVCVSKVLLTFEDCLVILLLRDDILHEVTLRHVHRSRIVSLCFRYVISSSASLRGRATTRAAGLWRYCVRPYGFCGQGVMLRLYVIEPAGEYLTA